MLSDTKARFEANFQKGEGCWLWTASCRNGYGRIRIGNMKLTASRVSYELYIGPIGDGKMVCHKCDNPTCVNPSHLFLGTRQQNIDDMVAKGRSVLGRQRGEENPKAKLTTEQVLAIRADKRSQSLIAAEYGVQQAAVSKIKLGKVWRHV